ncbi:MAG: hypothetical protein AAGF12_21835 [Myxococcota bacterium]
MVRPWFVLLAATAACTSGSSATATQVLVQVSFDSEVVAAGQVLRLRVWDRDGVTTYDQQFEMAELDLADATASIVLPITATDEDASRSWQYAATVLGGGLETIAEVRAEGGFVLGDRREVRLRFDASCLRRLCGPKSSCEDGECVDACVTPLGPGEVSRTLGEPCADRCRPIASAAAGGRSVCAVADGQLWCWGDNRFGQGGVAADEFLASPQRVGEFGDWLQVSLNEEYSCGIRERGVLYCWGQNSPNGRLGTGDTENVTPCCGDRIPGSWASVSAGLDHACGIRIDGSLWCWGRIEQLGVPGLVQDCGSTPNPCEPVRVDDNRWQEVAAGDRHTCALRETSPGESRVFCWGENRFGQLAQPLSTDMQSTPTPIEGNDWIKVTAAGDHTCGIRAGNRGQCWGDDRSDQTGCEPRAAESYPEPCEPETNQLLTDIAIGVAGSGDTSGHTCATTEAGEVWCWGTNRFAETDPFSPEGPPRVPAPVPIREGLVFTEAFAGFRHSCALSDRGALYCWGRNTRGELALGLLSDFHPPQPVCITE